MQSINILGDQSEVLEIPFKLTDCLVAGVGTSLQNLPTTPVIPLPDSAGICPKRLGGRVILNLECTPQALSASESGDSAFRRYTSAREDNDPGRRDQQRPEPFCDPERHSSDLHSME